jgi:hypothetical protein
MSEDAQKKQMEMMKAMQAQNASQMQTTRSADTAQTSQGGGGGSLIMSSCFIALFFIGCGVLITLAFTKKPPGK